MKSKNDLDKQRFRLVDFVLGLPLPRVIIWRPYRLWIDYAFASFLRKRLGTYHRPVAPAQVPPKELMLQTGAATQDSFDAMFKPGNGFSDRYQAVGKGTLLKWLKILEANHGFNLRTVGAVLEFGCGTGRLIQHFRSIHGLRVVGTDANRKMKEWCAETLGGAEFYNNELVPPLKFAEDASFDFVFALSVFTHIPADMQRSWLQEMRRILRPGGFLVCTVAGLRAMRRFMSPDEWQQMHREGFLEYTSSDQGASLSTKAGGSAWDIYQPKSEVIRVFGSELLLLDYLEGGGQDVLILRKGQSSAG